MLALAFLWQQLGPSSLAGVSVIVVMIPVTKLVAQTMGVMQKKLMKAKDNRVELNSEVLSGMKVIKVQAWEEPFQRRLLDLRQIELRRLFRYFIISSFSRLLWTFTPLAVALATFTAYVFTGHQLDVASALTALALFSLLRFPLFMLPNSTYTLVRYHLRYISRCRTAFSFQLELTSAPSFCLYVAFLFFIYPNELDSY